MMMSIMLINFIIMTVTYTFLLLFNFTFFIFFSINLKDEKISFNLTNSIFLSKVNYFVLHFYSNIEQSEVVKKNDK